MPTRPKRVQEAAKRSLGFDLEQVWKGFGKGLGDQNDQQIEILSIFLDMLFETSTLVDFCSVFDNFGAGMVNQNQIRAFATVKRTEKHLIFVSERDCVFSVKPNAGKGETKTKYNKVNAKHLKFS